MIDCLRIASQLRRRAARGFTLIELMVSIAIALFLIGGALAIVGRTRSTFAAQNQLSQLQDNERLAMTFMAEVIESGGYFPTPKLYTAAGVMPATGVFAAPGQAVYGTSTGAGDTVTIRFGAGLGDNVYGCTGASNGAVGPYDTYVNYFWVNTAVVAPQLPQLMCTFTNNAGTLPAVPLVNGVTQLTILYGVKRNPAVALSCTDTYLDANHMLAADWLNVCSIVVNAFFSNPLNALQPIKIQRVIAVMTSAGVNP